MTSVNDLIAALTFFAALGCGLMAGLFFAFSNFVMRALASLPPEKGVASMQAINVAVLNPLFLAIFSGTALACLGSILLALARWRAPGAAYLLAGGVLYLAGVVLVTVLFNVPRNDALGALDPAAAGSVSAWRGYVTGWTAWNHVRTVAASAATGSFVLAFSHLRGLAAA
jgi:uncharacterized membrane protein